MYILRQDLRERQVETVERLFAARREAGPRDARRRSLRGRRNLKRRREWSVSPSTHSWNALRWIRSREHSRAGRNSPRSIAR
jgi:hypothetical protein